MTKKKRGHPDAEEILARPWCYYCERDFDDLKILISHQKAKHFKCDRCGRRLNTAGGLNVHMTQVHKETLTAVENALPNRADLNVEIFGMEGIPDDILQQHKQRVLQSFYEAEAQRRATTGNPAPGSGSGGGAVKKPKVESKDDLKARLAAFKAKKAAAEENAHVSSGNGTPTGAGESPDNTAARVDTSNTVPAGIALFGLPNHPYQMQIASSGPFQQPYNHAGYGMPPQIHQQFPYPQGLPNYLPPPQQFPAAMGQPPPFSPLHGLPSEGLPPFGGRSPGASTQPNLGFARSPPPNSLNGSFARTPSLPGPPGLPQRPSFGAPPLTAIQMQQFHQASIPNGLSTEHDLPNDSKDQVPVKQTPQKVEAESLTPTITGTTVDELIASVTGTASSAEEKMTTTHTATTEKKPKKSQEKATRLIYTDNDVSPEEKMAKMSKYAFDPTTEKEDMILGDVEASVTGPAVGADDVVDNQG